MRKLIFIIGLVLLLSISLVSAHGAEIAEGKSIIDSGVDCTELTDEQLEAMGEYYMEQMHPGESHELMHKMMGLEEGSNEEEQFHINMAKSIYCGEGRMNYGMMDMMGGKNMMDSGMMGSYGSGYWSLFNVLYVILLIGLIILVYLWIYKSLKKK